MEKTITGVRVGLPVVPTAVTALFNCCLERRVIEHPLLKLIE